MSVNLQSPVCSNISTILGPLFLDNSIGLKHSQLLAC